MEERTEHDGSREIQREGSEAKWGTLRINVSGTAEEQGRDNGKKMTAVDSADYCLYLEMCTLH